MTIRLHGWNHRWLTPRWRNRTACPVLIAFLVTTLTSIPWVFADQVISIQDGDTIEVLYDNHPERIRLQGIDCPEKHQPYGNNAKHAISALVFGKEVTMSWPGFDGHLKRGHDRPGGGATWVNDDDSRRNLNAKRCSS